LAGGPGRMGIDVGFSGASKCTNIGAHRKAWHDERAAL
jgi:hypothetical protein